MIKRPQIEIERGWSCFLFNKQINKKRDELTWVQGMAVFLDVLVQGAGWGCLHLPTLSCKEGSLANRAREHEAAACMYVSYVHREN